MLQKRKTQNFIIFNLVDTMEMKPLLNREGITKINYHTMKLRTTLNMKKGKKKV